MAGECIVNVGIRTWYPQGSRELALSLDKVGYTGGRLFWIDEYPPGCPSHQDVPYAFKVYALEEAVRQGYTKILWCDSSVWFRKHPKPFFDVIERDGVYITDSGYKTGQWSSDKSLEIMGLSRDEAFDIHMVAAIFFGINVLSKAGADVLEWQSARARDGTFIGSHSNGAGEVSSDPRCTGHRHDQTALSVIWHRLGLPVHITPAMFQYFCGFPYRDHVLAYATGLPRDITI